MTHVLVSDSSVLIDLERGSLMVAVFRLSCEFSVPDLLYERELKPFNGPDLIKLGLKVEELDGNGINKALIYRRREPALSLPDVFALSLAESGGYILLTGDQALRGLAEAEKVECHGVLWVLDRMNDEAVASMLELHTGLETIASHPRCRLPKREVNIRLKHYLTEIEAKSHK